MLDTSSLRTWIEIDTSLIPHNIQEIKKIIGKTKIMGIVKANAYGHGDTIVAQALEQSGIDYFGVATIEEAIRLRKQGIHSSILILGYTPPASFPLLDQYRLSQSLLSLEYAQKLSSWAMRHGKVIQAHVKVDTGMNRTGILYQDGIQRQDQLKAIYALPGICFEGIFSHFPVSDLLDQECMQFTQSQIQWFEKAIEYVNHLGIDPGLRHIQNSHGILNYRDLGYEYCRPGLLFLGVTQDKETETVVKADLKPVLTWKTKVTLVKEIPAGASVSYGRHFIASSPRKIASLSVGYADGLPRACSNKGLEVLIHQKRAKIIGNICMDQCMIDVTDIENVQEGDEVILVGQDGNEIAWLDTISQIADTINNETLTRITNRVPRFSKN